MRTRFGRSFGIAALSCALAAAPGVARAQASYAENFENAGPINGSDQGPSNLIAAGWIFRNQSDPAVGAAWFAGDGFGGVPFEGAGYLSSDSIATDFFGGALSTWAVLPAIPNQQAGDTFGLWVFGGGSFNSNTWLDVRYSPSGGIGTGSGPTDVGDFTTVLFSAELPLALQNYQLVSVPVPGPGRLAMRFHSPFIMTWIGRGAILSVDALTVGPPQGPACGVPLPASGETVHWTAADSPLTICEDLLIPAGSTVTVEPGVEIIFEPDDALRVEGALLAQGTASEPVVFSGSAGVGSGLDVSVAGQADLSFVELGVRIFTGGKDAAVIVTDSLISAGGAIEGVPDLAVVERCQFVGGSLGGLTGVRGTVRAVDCDFTGGGYAYVAGLLHLDNVSIDGEQLQIIGESAASPTLLDNISVTNYASGAGVKMYGANFLLGPDFVTQGNLYPLELDWLGAGLLPGSRLPISGNVNNYVPAAGLQLGFERYWANTGVPYVLDGFPENHGGSLTVEAGTRLKFRPGAGAFLVGSAALRLEGTLEDPVVLESFIPSQPWWGLKWVDVFNAKVAHAIFDGGELAIQSDGGNLYMDHCVIRDCQTGYASVTGGIVYLRNSKVLNNNVGMTTTTTGRIDAESQVAPNIFAGNGVAVDYNNASSAPEFDYVWWDDASGPTTSENPGGTGEAVEGLFWAWFSPWLAAPPAQLDEPPHVKMVPTYFVAHAGEKIILRWESSDDTRVVEHRVEFADHGFPNEFQTVATLPGDADTYEFTVPIVEPTNLYTSPSSIRVVAVDEIGQEGWDERFVRIPYQEDFTVVPQEVTNLPTDAHPHDNIDVCWSPGGSSTIYVVMDGEGLISYHGGAGSCLPIGATLAYTSTDTARVLVLTTYGAGGRLIYSFSDYFTIRPDARYGDAPPAVMLDAPLGGEQFSGGGVIPVRWTASDDEALRAFHVQASYDGGVTWHYVVKDLPPGARAFNWRLPASAGIPDVRARVVTVDHRFQNSSATGGAFAIAPGAGGVPGDLDGDGDVDLTDLSLLLAAFGSCSGDGNYNAGADVDGSGCVELADLAALLANYGA